MTKNNRSLGFKCNLFFCFAFVFKNFPEVATGRFNLVVGTAPQITWNFQLWGSNAFSYAQPQQRWRRFQQQWRSWWWRLMKLMATIVMILVKPRSISKELETYVNCHIHFQWQAGSVSFYPPVDHDVKQQLKAHLTTITNNLPVDLQFVLKNSWRMGWDISNLVQ